MKEPYKQILDAWDHASCGLLSPIHDANLAPLTQMPRSDLRNYLESMDQEGLIERVRVENPDGFNVLITASGRIEVSKLRLSRDQLVEKVIEPTATKIIPKGLRSFSADDKDFFLELLPGPRRSDGLPESVHFWKTRIEETDPDKTFKLGLIHGPSGCGKSSLVRAGLLPNLVAHVHHVYVEATPDDTEAGLFRKLRNEFPNLKKIRSLPNFLSALRKGQAISAGQKVVIVVDQFEQWLHAKTGIEQTELIDALNQCDGGRVQTIVLVRDDFWTATTRFSTQTGIKFDHDSNAYFVDLFHQSHGEKVLRAFGQACGRVGQPVTSDQEEFIERAASRLALNGMILPVRLALFFLVFQGRKWTTQTLESIGGIENIELELLKKTFDFGYSNPIHRDHREAAQSVLGALLPESGSEIKRPKSWQELLDVSGYSSQPERFTALLRILDKDLFLITPTDPEKRFNAGVGHVSGPTDRFYQLTHDFLVPSLREWRNKDQEASQLVQAIWMAETKNVPQLVEKLDGLRFWADPRLRQLVEYPGTGSKERLHAGLALLPVDEHQVEYLYQRLLKASPSELLVLRDALMPHRETLVKRLWSVLGNSEGTDQYIQAASALASYDPSGAQWQSIGGKVAKAMVAVNAVHLGTWLDALRPVRARLTAPLSAIFSDSKRPETERSLAFHILDDYASDQPKVLADLLMDSNERHFSKLFRKLKPHVESVLPLLEGEIVKSLTDADDDQKDASAKRQARAGVALVRLGRTERIWPVLRHNPDPTLRSYLVNWLTPLGADPKLIVAELDRLASTAKTTPAPGQQFMDAVLFHPETSIRRALILALGAHTMESVSIGEREPLIGKLLDFYRNDPDAGIHGAVAWTLRKWRDEDRLKSIDAELSNLKECGDRRWYVNSQGQTFAVIDGPVEFQMGSPPTEQDRDPDETLRRMTIPRRFAIADRAVTVEQYQHFVRSHPEFELDPEYLDRYSPEETGPMIAVSWYGAAAYCNWLSEQEGQPKDQWCYVPNPSGAYDEGMEIPADILKRSGYRLPTEAEWEYACRSGTITSRYYGHTTDLLGEYAWYQRNSRNQAHPGGSLIPNDLGLFDMLGSVYEWVQDRDGQGQSDEINISEHVIEKLPRLLRGGTFDNPPAYVRSAYRGWYAPAVRDFSLGFRPSRTYY